MDRRSALTMLWPKSKSKVGLFAPPLSGLKPYQGSWGFEQASHLLRRTTFGVKYAELKTAIDKGLVATLNTLFQDLPLPLPPLNYEYASDPAVPIGSTWVEAPYERDAATNALLHRGYRRQSIQSWTLENVLNEGVSIREQLTLFWHNHFGVGDILDPKFDYIHHTLLRTYAWGNFKALVKKINVDPAMLLFLNGNQNTVKAPNENYGRELLELFTIGKGPLAGPGDYTHYTEQDIREVSRALTGWRDLGANNITASVKVRSAFYPADHDTQVKKLSHRFGNIEIANGNEKEHETVVDIIFSKSEVARFICRKLYRWFVYYDISAEVEQQVIQPMADVLIKNNYEIKPALMALLQSEHFFDALNMGPMIKNPMDYSINIIKQIGWSAMDNNNLATRHRAYTLLFQETSNQQMRYFDPPDVAGWKAYYQEPSFYRIWVNATTLQFRMKFVDRMASNNFAVNGVRSGLKILDFVRTLPAPTDPYLVVEDMVKILLPQSLTEKQNEELLSTFLGGTPDYEWQTIWSNYLKTPDNATARASAENKLRNLLKAILSLPEYHLA